MNKTTLLSILLILGAVLLLGYVFIKGDRPDATSGDDQVGVLLKEFSPDAVKSIVLKKGATEVELKRDDKKWIMPKQKNRAALSSRVDDLLKGAKDALVVKPRSNKNLDIYQLSPAKRTEVVFEREAGKTRLSIGKPLEYSSSFVQREDLGGVLEIDKNLAQNAGVREEKSEFILDPAYFYDLAILADTPEDCIAITITKTGEAKGGAPAIEKFQFVKTIPGKGPIAPKQEIGKDDKPVWEMIAPEKAPADEGKIASLCSTLLKLTAKGYADEVADKDRGLDKPAATVSLSLKDGTVRDISFGKIDKDEVFVAVAGKPDAFKVYKYVYDTATNTADLKKKEEKKEEEKKDEQKDKPATEVKPVPPSPKPETPKVPAPPEAPKVPAPAEKK